MVIGQFTWQRVKRLTGETRENKSHYLMSHCQWRTKATSRRIFQQPTTPAENMPLPLHSKTLKHNLHLQTFLKKKQSGFPNRSVDVVFQKSTNDLRSPIEQNSMSLPWHNPHSMISMHEEILWIWSKCETKAKPKCLYAY